MAKKMRKRPRTITFPPEVDDFLDGMGNVSEFVSSLVEREQNIMKNHDLDAIKTSLSRAITTRNDADRQIIELEELIKKIELEDKKRNDTEKMNKIEILKKEVKKSYIQYESMETNIKRSGLEEIEKEMIEEYKKNPSIIGSSEEMLKWRNKFREKCSDFSWGLQLAGYCIYKTERDKTATKK
jgi:acetyl/propionyl-CoA carboxylase alpha subunit